MCRTKDAHALASLPFLQRVRGMFRAGFAVHREAGRDRVQGFWLRAPAVVSAVYCAAFLWCLCPYRFGCRLSICAAVWASTVALCSLQRALSVCCVPGAATSISICPAASCCAWLWLLCLQEVALQLKQQHNCAPVFIAPDVREKYYKGETGW